MAKTKKWVSFVLIKLLMFLGKLNLGLAVTSFSVDPLGRQRLDRVLKLPGQNFDVGFAHYSGYVTANEESGRALFYWFFEAVEDPASKPVILWLNGGPGCSSIAYGEAEGIGPFHIKPDSKTLYLNPYSWNQAEDSLEFLLRWFERFPQYKGRDFYLSGESYAGHYVPQLSQAIVKYNSDRNEKAINLKGYMVGNALTDDHNDRKGVFQFMWATGLISDQTFKSLNLECDFQSFIHPSNSCNNVLDIVNEELGDIDPYSIFTPACHSDASQSNQLRKRLHMAGRISQSYDPCTTKHSVVYFNLPEVQQALHVDSNHAPSEWETCSTVVGDEWKDSAASVLDVYHEMIHAGLRIWVYSGHTDTILPVTGTRYNIDALNLTAVTPWRAWYDEGEVGGWSQEYEGLTFVTVRGAGHEVPMYRPKQALTLVKSFLAGSSMPGPGVKLVSSI